MSQMPPPPPGQPAPMGGTPAGAASNKKTYTILAYLVGWVTGLIFLFVGKDDPDVKWNAANSVVFFGGLSIISFIVGLIPVVQLLSIVIFTIGQWDQANKYNLEPPLVALLLGLFISNVVGLPISTIHELVALILASPV